MSTHIGSISAVDTYPLRHSVLWPDKPFNYVILDDDDRGYHYGTYLDTELVAVISLFVDGPTARFRKFATRPDQQHKGLGTLLLRHVFAEARRLGASTICCDARLNAATFYQRFGMEPTGEVFYKGPIAYQRYETRT
ncbi:GNAT family N-acetyltransferase [Fibrivirga algicola]|uniref:GNAT family N-acetyltransferase n=1 Tax=Fibrivirga algicola TaxID=2950420 RepID=A0ABX0QJP8_9BACT|nr:GNAT family N-acetyltransferase [Fibrivirga algicola]ARK11456.1 GNAT family acetyltransferase [Fibrella sp. ES10-3-2-2]NID12686.1 GNAT family N-acetyltransferase [Fibrivirga algicola]